MKIVERTYSPSTAYRLARDGVPPVLARLYAARGIGASAEVTGSLADLLPPEALTDCGAAAELLQEAITTQRRLLIISDYDADGATACAVGLRGLRAFGATVGYLIPNRLEHGYGLTPEIVRIAAGLTPRPSLIITVDNGISSHAGIAEANRLGLEVLVTDHHLPAQTLPEARLIVDPNRRDCTFPSKALAGCGVMWYVLWALEQRLRASGAARPPASFTVASLLPIVAIGTVADLVPLDANNRLLVRHGLEQIRRGPTFAGIEALATISKVPARELATTDIGFYIGPRINAAGRLETMDAGVECLTTDDPLLARSLAEELHAINTKRREIEADTVRDAVLQVMRGITPERTTAVAYDPSWHKGVIGIVAGRVKELVYRPTFVFTSDATGRYTGSGRSIPGFHLRDALDRVALRDPTLLVKFGGHAMAAGATLRRDGLADFIHHFEAVAQDLLTPADLHQQIETDGPLDAEDMTLETVATLRSAVWGQAFPEPSFTDVFTVVTSARMGQDNAHLRLTLEKGAQTFQAVKFRAGEARIPRRLRAVYKLSANIFRDETRLQLMLDHFEAA